MYRSRHNFWCMTKGTEDRLRIVRKIKLEENNSYVKIFNILFISIVKWTYSEGFIAIGDISVIYIVPNVPWVSERLIILYYVSLIKFSKSKRSHGSIRSNRSTIWANRQINRRRSNRQTRSNRSNRSTRISKSSRAF